MHVLILAGGQGVRLRPLTTGCPKPLLLLGDRPILTRIVEHIPAELPVTIIVAPQLAAPFQRWQESLSPPHNVRLYLEPYRESGPLGPVRALSACVDELELEDDVLLLMGDSLLPFQLEQFFAGADSQALRLAAYRLPDISQANRYGVLEIGAAETVEHFVEKPAQPRSSWIFTGCLSLPQRLLPTLPRAGAEGPSNAGDLVAEYLRRGERIEVYRAEGEWHDIGTLASYLQAHHSLLSDSRRRSLVDQGNQLRGSVYVHPSAQVTHSVLQDCVVQAGARVANADLSFCVVQPHASIAGRQLRAKLISNGSELPFAGE